MINKIFNRISNYIDEITRKINVRGGIFGFYIIRDHYYQPIPNFNKLLSNSKLLNYRYESNGINLRIKEQLKLLKNISIYTKYLKNSRIKKVGYYYLNNGSFGYNDSIVYYGIISYFKPKIILEVGAGNNTLVSLSAVDQLKKQKLSYPKIIAIEPYPSKMLLQNSSKIKLIKKKVEELPLKLFDSLKDNDILFIDSSHVIKTKNDVVYLYLEILPRLKKGVIIQIHDINFPYEIHPAIFKIGYSWNEQYLLHALLLNSKRYKIIYSGFYIGKNYYNTFKKYFPNAIKGQNGGSFYIQIIE